MRSVYSLTTLSKSLRSSGEETSGLGYPSAIDTQPSGHGRGPGDHLSVAVLGVDHGTHTFDTFEFGEPLGECQAQTPNTLPTIYYQTADPRIIEILRALDVVASDLLAAA